MTVVAADADGLVELELDPGSRCAGCAGLCAWARPGGVHRARFRAAASLAPGASVRVTLPAEHVLSSALLLHGVPLAALLAGACIGTLAVPSDLGTLAGALAGLAFAVPASRRLRRRAEASTLRRASVEVLSEPESKLR